MIPADLFSRLRVLLDTPLPEVSGAAKVRPVDTAEFANGQRFTAQILNPLPDGSYRALVAGRTVTLSLPGSVKSGDVLELVVNRNTAQSVFAQQVQPAAESSPRPQLSPAAQLFSQLISGKLGNPAPAALNQGAPLLAQVPPGAAQLAPALAPALAKAITESGLFYESHQAQWLEGERPLERLFTEPQGRQSAAAQPPATEAEPAAANGRQVAQAGGGQTPVRAEAEAVLRQAAGNEKSTALTQLVSRELQPLVHQQLDSLVNQQLVWQGQVWPGQMMDWKIDVPDRQQGGTSSGDEAPETWRTTLRLQFPGLGDVDAELVLTGAGLALRIETGNPGSAELLRGSIPELASALEAAGIPLTGSAVIARESSA